MNFSTTLRGTSGVYAVTGADAGLGLTTAATLIDTGATVVMGCADASKGRQLAEKINATTQKESAIILGTDGLDLGSARSINAWSGQLLDYLRREDERLEALVHQAGVMGLGKYTLCTDGDEEMQWATNYVGAFRLTQRLWDRIVSDDTLLLCLTSTSHCTPDAPLEWSRSEETYHGWRSYQQSKLAALLFSNECNRRLAAAGSGATSRAVCESDKWFIMPQLLLPDDKEELAAGPATTMAALRGLGEGGSYLVDGQIGTPGTHGESEGEALRLWEESMKRL